MSNRKEEREKKNFRVKIVDGEIKTPANVTSISRTGMSLKTAGVFPTFKVIDILVKIGSKMLALKGSVRWVVEAVEGSPDRLNEIGIALQNPPPEYVRHFDQ